MAQQLRIDQYIKNCNGGNITITNRLGRPEKPVAESKGAPRSIRFLPDDEKDFQRAARAERISFNEYIEKTAQIGVHFSLSNVEFLVNEASNFHTLFENWDLIKPILEKLNPE